MDEIIHNLLGIAEAGGNRLLALDAQAVARCAELQGSVIAVELTDLERTLYLHPGGWGLRLSLQQPACEVDATIRGRVVSLINLATEQDKISTSIQQRIEISGNTAVAQKFQKLLVEIDIDWEELLSRYVGDTMAFRIGQGLRKTRDWMQLNVESFSASGREYLQEEVRSLPSGAEYRRFQQQVTDLRHDVDRLEALFNHKLGVD